MNKSNPSLLDARLVRPALLNAFRKLDPRAQWANPVMFITELGAIACTLVVLRDAFSGHFSGFNLQIALWLWFTVLFANFAEALAEGRGKAQADSLRKARKDTVARGCVTVVRKKSPRPNCSRATSWSANPAM